MGQEEAHKAQRLSDFLNLTLWDVKTTSPIQGTLRAYVYDLAKKAGPMQYQALQNEYTGGNMMRYAEMLQKELHTLSKLQRNILISFAKVGIGIPVAILLFCVFQTINHIERAWVAQDARALFESPSQTVSRMLQSPGY